MRRLQQVFFCTLAALLFFGTASAQVDGMRLTRGQEGTTILDWDFDIDPNNGNILVGWTASVGQDVDYNFRGEVWTALIKRKGDRRYKLKRKRKVSEPGSGVYTNIDVTWIPGNREFYVVADRRLNSIDDDRDIIGRQVRPRSGKPKKVPDELAVGADDTFLPQLAATMNGDGEPVMHLTYSRREAIRHGHQAGELSNTAEIVTRGLGPKYRFHGRMHEESNAMHRSEPVVRHYLIRSEGSTNSELKIIQRADPETGTGPLMAVLEEDGEVIQRRRIPGSRTALFDSAEERIGLDGSARIIIHYTRAPIISERIAVVDVGPAWQTLTRPRKNGVGNRKEFFIRGFLALGADPLESVAPTMSKKYAFIYTLETNIDGWVYLRPHNEFLEENGVAVRAFRPGTGTIGLDANHIIVSEQGDIPEMLNAAAVWVRINDGETELRFHAFTVK